MDPKIPMPGDPAGWAVVYGDRFQLVARFEDRGRAEEQVLKLRGLLYPLVFGGMPENDPYGLDIDPDA